MPEELAILSIGNAPLICENQSVPLSSIDQNLERGGYEAASLLHRLMEGGRSTDMIAVTDPLVRQGLKYIETNLATSFGAVQIATALGITQNVLHKHFAAELGRSVGREIARRRLAKVKLLLRNTKMSISQIAADTGYCTPSHLSNAFHAATGTSPRAWRAKVR